MSMTFILAHNARTAESFIICNMLDRNTHRYLSHACDLYGARGCTVIRIGLWHERPDLRSILAAIRDTEAVVVDAE